MKGKVLLLMVVLSVCSASLRAQICAFGFPPLSVCSGDSCSLLINMTPTGVVRVLSDAEYGTQLGINFGINSVFDLGDFGRMNFGGTGGVEAVYPPGLPLATCQAKAAGLAPYIVEMAAGGWLDLSSGNRMEFEENNVLVLADGSKIDGRLDIETEGSVALVSPSGDVNLPNVDISAEQGITVSVQGDVELGDLDNSSDDGGGSGGSSGGGNAGINISAEGNVAAGNVDSDGELRIATSGDITIAAINQADSIFLLIDSTEGGTITVGDSRISGSDGPVTIMCSASEDCDDFNLDSAGLGGPQASDPCNPDNLDPNKPNTCGGGSSQAADVLFWLLLLSVYRCRRCNR